MHKILVATLLSVLFTCTLLAQRTVGLIEYADNVTPGYFLFNTFESPQSFLVDKCGELIQQWDHDVNVGTAIELLPNGNLVRTEINGTNFNASGAGGQFSEYDWSGNLVRRIVLSNDTIRAHHDFTVMPNGNLLVILWELHLPDEVESMGGNPDILADEFWSETILEIAPTTNSWEEVWRWRVWDHLVQDFSNAAPNFDIISRRPRRFDINMRGPYVDPNIDWLHFNSITYDAQNDEIILSARSSNEIYIIDHSTTTAEAATSTGGQKGKGGDLLYRYGNDQNYTQEPDHLQVFFGQHDARTTNPLGPYTGQYSVFNNGINKPSGEISSVYRWKPNRDSDGNFTLVDNRFQTPEVIRELDLPLDLYSSIMSSAQGMVSGGYQIALGRLGIMVETDSMANVTWRYVNPITTQGPLSQGTVPGNHRIFQVLHYDEDDPRFAGKDLSPGEPLEANPITSLCLLLSNETTALSTFKVYPNPFERWLMIEDYPKAAQTFSLFNIQGQELASGLLNQQITFDDLPQGMYSLALKDKHGQIIAHKRISKY